MATWGPIQLRLKGSKQVEFDGEASPAPGGGSMPLQVARVTLTHDDILALPSAPFELVPAPASGSIIFPIAAVIVADTTAAAYTNIDAASSLFLFVPGSGSAASLMPLDEGLNSAISEILGFGLHNVLTLGLVGDTAAGGALVEALGPPAPTSDLDGVALSMFMDNRGSSDLADGDPANTLKVSVYYDLVTL